MYGTWEDILISINKHFGGEESMEDVLMPHPTWAYSSNKVRRCVSLAHHMYFSCSK